MKKTTPYVFWFTLVFLTSGVFALWASFFQPSSLLVENPRRVALGAGPSIPNAVLPKQVLKAQAAPSLIPKSAQKTTPTKPASTRSTKTS